MHRSQVLIGSIALFWLTSGNGLRPIASIIHDARSFPDSTSSAPKRRWGSRQLPSMSFFSRPDAVRQSSLPTIMTHGMLDSRRPSRAPSVTALPLPTPAVTHVPLVWPAPQSPLTPIVPMLPTSTLQREVCLKPLQDYVRHRLILMS